MQAISIFKVPDLGERYLRLGYKAEVYTKMDIIYFNVNICFIIKRILLKTNFEKKKNLQYVLLIN